MRNCQWDPSSGKKKVKGTLSTKKKKNQQKFQASDSVSSGLVFKDTHDGYLSGSP